MAKRLMKCVFCGQRDRRHWRYCSRCGERYRWHRPAQTQVAIDEGWKQVAALSLLVLLVMAIIASGT